MSAVTSPTVNERKPPDAPMPRGMPGKIDVVIIGGGIAGIAAAWFLAKRGVRVIVCEKGRIAAEQSQRAFGWVCSLGLDPLKLDLTLRSKTLWRGLAGELGTRELGYVECGMLHLCETPQDVEMERSWIATAARPGMHAQIVEAAGLASLLPGCARSYAGAGYEPSDARIEPRLAIAAWASAARDAGVQIEERCAVRSIDSFQGRVRGVTTERGQITCDHVVVAAGVWSRLFLRNAGIFLPQLKVHSSLVRIAPLDSGPEACVAAHGYAFRREVDGGYVFGPDHGHGAVLTPDCFRLFRRFLPALISQRRILRLRLGREFVDELCMPVRWRSDRPTPFERYRVLDAQADVALNLATIRNATRAFPCFENARVVEHWAGMIDATPDSVPVISAVDAVPGMHVCTGFSAYGITQGPAAGEMIAAQITGDTSMVDPNPYRHSRFVDGTRLRVAP